MRKENWKNKDKRKKNELEKMEREKVLSKCHYSNELETREYPERDEVLGCPQVQISGIGSRRTKNSNISAHILHLEQDRDKEEIEKPYRKTQVGWTWTPILRRTLSSFSCFSIFPKLLLYSMIEKCSKVHFDDGFLRVLQAIDFLHNPKFFLSSLRSY